jgi:hypothetical protein
MIDTDDARESTKENFEEMSAISEKLGAYEKLLPGMVQNAFPKEETGSLTFMATALIGDVVKAHKPIGHPLEVYATAFLNMTLKQEATYGILYRKKYGPRSDIAQVVIDQKSFRK